MIAARQARTTAAGVPSFAFSGPRDPKGYPLVKSPLPALEGLSTCGRAIDCLAVLAEALAVVTAAGLPGAVTDPFSADGSSPTPIPVERVALTPLPLALTP